MRATTTAVAGVALFLGGCGGSTHTSSTVISTPPAETKTVTKTVAPPGPKTSIEANGTYIVNKEIAAGTYRTDGGKYGCYWARLRSFDTNDIIDNNVGDGPQVVRILPTDTAFMTRSCGSWHKID